MEGAVALVNPMASARQSQAKAASPVTKKENIDFGMIKEDLSLADKFKID